MRDKLKAGLGVAALLAVGALAWWLQLSSQLDVHAETLTQLPQRIAGFEATDVPLDTAVAEMLRADFNVQRAYELSDEEDPVWMYVGYYGTARGGRPEHTPWVCYEAQGWQIEAADVVEIDPARGLRANEIVVEHEDDRQLVLFWMRSQERTGLLGGIDLTLDRLRNRFASGRADGALVRLSTPLSNGSKDAARERLVAFAAQLDPLLDAHWPQERRGSAEQP